MVWLADGIPGFDINVGMPHNQRMDALEGSGLTDWPSSTLAPMHDLYCMQHGFHNLFVADVHLLHG